MVSDNAGQAIKVLFGDTYGEGTTYLHSRASGLLYKFLIAFGRQGTGVIIPSASGFSLPQIVISAGYIPIFADVRSADFNLGLIELENALEHARCNVTICIAIHSFGYFLDLDSIGNYCKLKGLLLIEDICQLIGTGYEGRHGDLVLASFGRHKSLDGGAGGALFIRNKDYLLNSYLDHEETQFMSLVTPDVQSDFISTYYQIRNAEKSGTPRGGLALLTASNLNYIASGSVKPDWNKIFSAAKMLTYNNKIRQDNADYFLQQLSDIQHIELPSYAKESAPWRFTFQCKNAALRDELLNNLRHEVIHASAWYSSLSLDFIKYTDQITPFSDKFENSVINLLVDKTVSKSYLEKSVTTIRAFFENRD
jgi:dTDP-4-amino-4,6-dideoxygalactose transaminase